MTVGRSWRTPAKHDLMRNLIGKEVGVVSSKSEIKRSVWYEWVARIYLQALEAGCKVHIKPNIINGRPGLQWPNEYPEVA